MNTVQAARKILRDAELALRELIERALAEQRYSEIKDIANLAEGVSNLLISPASHLNDQIALVKAIALPKKGRAIRRSSTGYPKFERDDNRLIKIGWSKKNKKVYEHRVPKDAIITFAHHLADSVKLGKVFNIDDILPVKDASDEELPSYQVYVMLAWLRDTGAVDKMGRDGYVVRDFSLANGRIEDLWNALVTQPV